MNIPGHHNPYCQMSTPPPFWGLTWTPPAARSQVERGAYKKPKADPLLGKEAFGSYRDETLISAATAQQRQRDTHSLYHNGTLLATPKMSGRLSFSVVSRNNGSHRQNMSSIRRPWGSSQ
jgi:hypothetical protein